MTSPHDPYAPTDPDVVEARTVEPKSTEGAADETTAVPKGSSADVLTWVGDDKDKAQQALDAEKSSGKPRKGLVEELEEITGK